MYQYSWKYYTTGTKGIIGDYAEAIWIDHDGDPYIAAYTPGWEEVHDIAECERLLVDKQK